MFFLQLIYAICNVSNIIMNNKSVFLHCGSTQRCPLGLNLFWAVDVIFNNFLSGRGQLQHLAPASLKSAALTECRRAHPCTSECFHVQRGKATHTLIQANWIYRHTGRCRQFIQFVGHPFQTCWTTDTNSHRHLNTRASTDSHRFRPNRKDVHPDTHRPCIQFGTRCDFALRGRLPHFF